MSNGGVEQQVAGFRQQMANVGFTGSAIIDIHPNTGIIRIKLNVPPEKLGQFITNYTNVLKMSLNAMNLEVKTHIEEGVKSG